MAQKVDGTDNVYVLAVKGDGVHPAQSQEQIDDMLTESMALQLTQIDDFVAELYKLTDKPEIINYASLMKHLQSECVFHLSALASAAIVQLAKERKEHKAAIEKANSNSFHDGYNHGYNDGYKVRGDCD